MVRSAFEGAPLLRSLGHEVGREDLNRVPRSKRIARARDSFEAHMTNSTRGRNGPINPFVHLCIRIPSPGKFMYVAWTCIQNPGV